MIIACRVRVAADWDWQDSTGASGLGKDAAGSVSLGDEACRCTLLLSFRNAGVGAIVVRRRADRRKGGVDR